MVVLGAWLGGVAAAHTTHNPDWREGMGSSLRWGLNELLNRPGPTCDQPRRAVITLVDLPGLTGSRSRKDCAKNRSALAAASYQGRQGHPVLIGEEHWPALIRQLHGDKGHASFCRRTRPCWCLLSSWRMAATWTPRADCPTQISQLSSVSSW